MRVSYVPDVHRHDHNQISYLTIAVLKLHTCWLITIPPFHKHFSFHFPSSQLSLFPEFNTLAIMYSRPRAEFILQGVPTPGNWGQEQQGGAESSFDAAPLPPPWPNLRRECPPIRADHSVSTLHGLAEMTIMAASRELTLNLKCENLNQGESFLKHFVEVLLGSNGLLSL
eukprot:Em0126g12a